MALIRPFLLAARGSRGYDHATNPVAVTLNGSDSPVAAEAGRTDTRPIQVHRAPSIPGAIRL